MRISDAISNLLLESFCVGVIASGATLPLGANPGAVWLDLKPDAPNGVH